MNWAGRLWDHYKAYFAHSRDIPKYTGMVGTVAFPLFYLLHEVRSTHDFDSAWLRGGAAFMCLLLALRDRWPGRLRAYYAGWSYLTYTYCLPFLWVFMSLKNNGGSVAVANTFMAVFFLVLLTDWRNTVVMLAAGIGLAALVYVLTSANPSMPVDYIGRLPTLILVVVGGSVFKLSEKQIQAERLDAATALAGSIAHEMRNPLGQIKHNLEKIQHSLQPLVTSVEPQHLSAPQAEALYCHVAESETAVRRGLQVIAMTMDEVSSKPVDTSSFACLSAAEATGKAVQEYAFESSADAAKLDLRVDEDFYFKGDETAYLFVLFNLIKNAAYYLPRYPEAQVTISVGPQQVKVRDTGPGIAPEVLAKLFEPFTTAGKQGGTGLGLAYCRRVMRGFGGDISCRSVAGEYTEFTLSFPPVTEQEREAHREVVLGAARIAFAGKRLLIVDDDAAQRTTTRHKLQPLGVAVDQAAGGQRALEALALQHYDLVLLDLNMPVIDGYTVAERIRRGDVPENRGVRIVAYTSEPAHLASAKARRSGMDGFVSKPCAQLPLVQALQQAMERVTARDEPEAVLAGRRILLADDSSQSRKTIAAFLKHAGAAVTEAAHGGAVLDHLRGDSQSWDAIVMDISMPGMDGLQAAQAIRASRENWRSIPIVALTAYSDQRSVQAARSAGMNDFLVKPVNASVLYDKLRHLTSRTFSSPMLARAGAAPLTTGALLNLERLESYRRMGMLRELLDDYIPEIGRLVEELRASASREDLQHCQDLLHSLLGTSGDAGAQALHQLVRGTYVPMIEGQTWPASPVWVQKIAAAAEETMHALADYGANQAALSTA